MIKVFLMLILCLSCSNQLKTKDSKENFIYDVLKSKEEKFAAILVDPDKYELQLIYTQINRDKDNRPSLTDYSWRLNEENYFYPASSIKFPAAVLALEKINNLKIKGLNKYTSLTIDSANSGQFKVESDSSSENGKASIGHYIKKVFLVSDNDAFNHLYEFLGQEQLNQGLWEKGFKNVALRHRLSIALSKEENRHTNPFTFWDNYKLIYSQRAQYNSNEIAIVLPNLLRGKGYLSNGEIINEPFDFSAKNYIALKELHGILKTIIFPESVPREQRFNLSADDYTFLYKYMSMLPSESDFPKYDKKDYYDSYVKFLMFGDSKTDLPEHIRIFNKIGMAYGYLVDTDHIVDFKNKVEFFLSAVIHVNKNRIFNDGVYEYEKIGLPFLSQLGQTFYEYELSRKRAFLPDLSRFSVD